MSTISQEHATVSALRGKISTHTAQVAIIGMGYVGLPVALYLARKGFKVLGFDKKPDRVEAIKQSSSYVDDIRDEELKPLVDSGHLDATTDVAALADADVIIICVPTPLNKNMAPDICYIEDAVSEISRFLRKGQLVVLESTTYPGTTEELVLPILNQSGLNAGEDFFLAYSPERVDPGNKNYSIANTPKVVGGLTSTCLKLATEFYQQFIETVVPVSSPKAAEMTKLFENTFRAVNIGLVNEMALVCDKLNLNTWEVVDAAATKPFGIMKFSPGPGIGGHCIPVDPFYLTWKVRELGFQTRFIDLAGEINILMPHFVREKVIRALGRFYKSVNGSNILVLGVAYKPNIQDAREAPARYVMDILAEDGARLSYHDPFIPTFRDKGERWYENTPLTATFLQDADCVVILTSHDCFDYEFIVANAKVVVDTRNACQHLLEKYPEKIMLL